MKRMRDRKIVRMEMNILVFLLVEVVLCCLYIFGIIQNHWFQNLFLGLGVLIHFMLMLFEVMKGSKNRAIAAGLGILIYTGAWIWIMT